MTSGLEHSLAKKSANEAGSIDLAYGAGDVIFAQCVAFSWCAADRARAARLRVRG